MRRISITVQCSILLAVPALAQGGVRFIDATPGHSQCRRNVGDPSIAVGHKGPNSWILHTTNSRLSVRYRLGGAVYETRLDRPWILGRKGFFDVFKTSPPKRIVDPKTLYDQYADRFVVMALDKPSSATGVTDWIYLAYSLSADPRKRDIPRKRPGWYKFRMPAKIRVNNVDGYPDFIGLAVTPLHLVYTGLLFDAQQQFLGQVIRVFNRASLLNGRLLFQDFVVSGGTTSEFFTPAHTFGSSAQTYLISTSEFQPGVGRELRIMAIDRAFRRKQMLLRTKAGNYLLPLAANAAPQRGSTATLDVLDGRILSACYRDDSDMLYACHAVRTSRKPTAKTVVRWYGIKMNAYPLKAPVLVHDANFDLGVVRGQPVHTFSPAIMQDRLGNVGLVCARSSANEFPSIHVAGRRVCDPPSVMRRGLILAWSDTAFAISSNNPQRWGDYFDIALDAFDGGSFWATGTIAKKGPAYGLGCGVRPQHWQAIIGHFDVAVFGSWKLYGQGYPGTGGRVPFLHFRNFPRIGHDAIMQIENSSGLVTPAVVLHGVAKPALGIPTPFGGSLWVDVTKFFLPASIVLPAAGLLQKIPVPNYCGLIGKSLFFQAIQYDAGAKYNLAFSGGLEMKIGQ